MYAPLPLNRSDFASYATTRALAPLVTHAWRWLEQTMRVKQHIFGHLKQIRYFDTFLVTTPLPPPPALPAPPRLLVPPVGANQPHSANNRSIANPQCV